MNLRIELGLVDWRAEEVRDATHLPSEILLEVREVHHEDVGKVLRVVPCLRVVEQGPEGPPVFLPRVLSPRCVEPLVEDCPDGVVAVLAVARVLPRREFVADEARGLVEGGVPHLVAELVVVHEGHESVPAIACYIDVLLSRIVLERVSRQVGLQEAATGDALDHALLDLARGYAEIDPRGEIPKCRRGLAIEEQLAHYLLHPCRAALVGGGDDDVVIAGFDDVPRLGVEVVGRVGLGLGPAGHVGCLVRGKVNRRGSGGPRMRLKN